MPVTLERSPSLPEATPILLPLRRRRFHPLDVRAATRRRLLGGGVTVGLAALLAACGEDAAEDGGQDGGAPAGPWELTDDRGETITLDEPPQRIVAYVSAAAALWDYGIRPVGTFGPQRLEDGSPDPQAGNMDLDEVESVGDVWGELNIDKLASLEPDLIVTTTPDTAAIPYWYIQEEAAAQVEQLAPILTLQFAARPLPESLERFAELARALRPDADAIITEGQAELERATGELESAAAEQAQLTVLAVSPTADNLYIGSPAIHADLQYFAEAGLQVVEPENIPDGEYWEALSWEQADKYPADVLLYDTRATAGQLTPEQLAAEKPVWAQLPAVQAQQVVPWRVEAPLSYAIYATVLDELTSALADLKKVT